MNVRTSVLEMLLPQYDIVTLESYVGGLDKTTIFSVTEAMERAVPLPSSIVTSVGLRTAAVGDKMNERVEGANTRLLPSLTPTGSLITRLG
jgi:hypothetical protein